MMKNSSSAYSVCINSYKKCSMNEFLAALEALIPGYKKTPV